MLPLSRADGCGAHAYLGVMAMVKFASRMRLRYTGDLAQACADRTAVEITKRGVDVVSTVVSLLVSSERHS